jgi:acetylornithine deacetylase/succinyl-diaminopimelate desuccinylase-like protein
MPASDLGDRIHALMPQAKDDLARLVAFKSVADVQQFPIEECVGAAGYVAEAFARAGVQDVRLIDLPYGHPAVYGHTPAPPGTPTVLLYAHYDVQPPMDEGGEWRSPPFELTERDGRWYGRGAADCKGSLVAHLTALRAFGGRFPVGIKVIIEGSEEQGLDELESFVPANADLLRADAILVADTGNVTLGVPTLTTTLRGIVDLTVTVRTLEGPLHSGMFGGAAPDALLALIAMLATLHDAAGNTTIHGLVNDRTWPGAAYPADQFRRDARVLDGVDLVGSGSVAEMVWARLAVSVLGIDCPRVAGASNAVQAAAAAKVSMRVPPGFDARAAQDALIAHLTTVAPWNVGVQIQAAEPANPFVADTSGPAYETMRAALRTAYGQDVTTAGQGASIPLTNVLHQALPHAEILMLGIEEPACLIHAPNESVSPDEIERHAHAEALFFERLAGAWRERARQP